MANVTPFKKSEKDANLCKAIDELSVLQSCFAAISDLMIPDHHLQEHERDHLAMLMDYLTKRHEEALNQVRQGGGHD